MGRASLRSLGKQVDPAEEIEAIETVLHGVRFRSRLEAKWALWCREMGIATEYEPEAVHTKRGRRWCDFWLRDLGLWAEIKPTATPPDAEMALCLAEQTGSGLLWVAGEPWPNRYEISLFGHADRAPITGLRWAIGRRDESLWLMRAREPLAIRLWPTLDAPLTWENAQRLEWPRPDGAQLKAAYIAASTYRFEEQ